MLWCYKRHGGYKEMLCLPDVLNSSILDVFQNDPYPFVFQNDPYPVFQNDPGPVSLSLYGSHQVLLPCSSLTGIKDSICKWLLEEDLTQQ